MGQKLLVLSSKNAYISVRLQKEARKFGIKTEFLSIQDLANRDFILDIEEYYAFYVRNPYDEGDPKYLPETIKLARQFKEKGRRVIDEEIAKGILGEGKMRDYEMLKKENIPVPATHPFKSALSLKDNAVIKYPFIIKWIYGLKGKGFYLIKDRRDLDVLPKNIQKKELMVQELIDAEYEYKIITVGYKTLPVVWRLKKEPAVFKPNSGKTEVLHAHQAIEAVNLAEKAARILGRELAKVDLVQKGNNIYILEVNRWPGILGFESATGFNVAAEFIKYLLPNAVDIKNKPV